MLRNGCGCNQTGIKKNIRTILSFEIPSSTEWSYSSFGKFTPNYFENINNHVKEKIKLMKIYNTETRKVPHPRSSVENITFNQEWLITMWFFIC